MKKILLSITFAMLYTFAFGQEIKESQIDDFTGNRIVTTSWEHVSKDKVSNPGTYTYMRLSLLNNKVYLHVKIMTGRVDRKSVV